MHKNDEKVSLWCRVDLSGKRDYPKATMTVDTKRGRACIARFIRLLNQIDTWYKEANWFSALVALLAATFVVILPQQFLTALFDSLEAGPGSQVMESAGFIERVFLGSLLAPLIETALFQWGPIRLLSGKYGFGPVTTIFASATLFAVTHTYSWGYAVFAFAVGLVLAYGYCRRNYLGGNAFLIVFMAHAARNLVATVARAL